MMKRIAAVFLVALLCLAAAVALAADLAYTDKSLTLFVGDVVTPAMNVSGDAVGKEIKYSSSSSRTASVDTEGVITAKVPGNATITATVAGTQTKAQLKLTVLNPVKSVTVNHTGLTIFSAGSEEIAALLSGDLTWAADHKQSAAQQESLLAALSPEEVNTLETLPVLLLRKGSSVQITARCSPADASSTQVSMISSNTAVVEKRDGMTLYGAAPGEALVTVYSKQNPEVCARYHVLVVSPVTSFSLKRDTGYLFVGESEYLSPAVSPKTGTLALYKYKSSAPDTISVDDDGLITALKKGSAEITVTVQDGSRKSATLTVRAHQPPTSIQVREEQVLIAAGERATLHSTVLPSTASDKTVTYLSTDTSVATVSETGTITGKRLGTCEIIISSTLCPDVKAYVPVTVIQKVTKVVANPTTLSIYMGDRFQLGWEVLPEDASDKTVSFLPGDSGVVSVSDTGLVTGLKRGSATIRIRTEDGSQKYANVSITVKQKPTGIKLSAETTTVPVGTPKTLTAAVQPSTAADKTVHYMSSDTSVATVNASGRITGLREGQCIITAIHDKFPEYTAECVVSVIVPCTRIRFNQQDFSLQVGDFAYVSAVTSPDYATNPGYTLSSSNNRIATVDQTGRVQAVSGGTCTLYAKTIDGSDLTARLNVTVIQPVEGVYMRSDSARVGVGEGVTLTAIIQPENATNKRMSWMSSDTSIATVEGNSTRPTVYGRRWGNVMIYGTTEDGNYTTACNVSVGDWDRALMLTDLYLAQNNIRMVAKNRSNMTLTGFSYTITCFDMEGNPLPCTVWGTNSFDGTYRASLYMNESTQNMYYTFNGYALPAERIGKALVTITGYTADNGFSRMIAPDKQETWVCYADNYQGSRDADDVLVPNGGYDSYTPQYSAPTYNTNEQNNYYPNYPGSYPSYPGYDSTPDYNWDYWGQTPVG